MNRGVSNRCARSRPKQRWLGAAAALVCVPLFASPAMAQTATGSAQVTIVEPLGLVKIQDLNFGRIVAGAAIGRVIVDPNTGACSVVGPVVSAGGCQFSEFAGMGVRRFTVRFQIPTTVTLTGPGGATMVADTFTLGTVPGLVYIGGNGNGLGNGNRRYQITSNTGIFTFRVGGRLTVGANQTPGIYNGTFNVTVQYQ